MRLSAILLALSILAGAAAPASAACNMVSWPDGPVQLHLEVPVTWTARPTGWTGSNGGVFVCSTTQGDQLVDLVLGGAGSCSSRELRKSKSAIGRRRMDS